MTSPATFRFTLHTQRMLMGTVFFVGVILLVVSVSVLGASLLGLYPVKLSLGLSSLMSGVAAIGAAIGLAN